ncbi:MAG: KH domain-containing protein [Clostridiaceae bacterium]|nr:KH domain-containing protein [Clostridiaceae bacterium]
MDTSLKDLLVYIVRGLVDDPTAIDVREAPGEDDSVITLELRVAKEDMGKVIGRQGRIARELRTIMRSAANHMDRRVNVEICD